MAIVLINIDDSKLPDLRKFVRAHHGKMSVLKDFDETAYLLRSDANRKMLEKSIKEVEKGKLVKVNFPRTH